MLLNRSWGARGHPFAQHYSCPTVLRCSIGSTSGGCGDISLCGKKYCLNRTGTSPALNRQGGNVLVAAIFAVVFLLPKMNVPLTQVALVARPCAPAAQLTDDSSSSSRRLAISLCPLRGHLILSKTAPSVCLLQNENGSIKSFGQIDSS